MSHQYTETVEAATNGKSYRYPDDVSYEFYQQAQRASRATDGSGLVKVTLDGTAAAALVPLDLVEYALRHGWGR